MRPARIEKTIRAAAATAPAWSPPRWIQPLVFALAAVCLLGLFSTEIGDTDFWWHLKTGEYVVTHRTLPLPDPFSYTTNQGAPAYPGEELTRSFNLTHEWLAQAAWYLVYRVAGFAGVVLFKALLLASFCGIAGFLAYRRSRSFYAGVGAAFAAAAVAMWFSADRPALVTFLLVAVFVLLLELRRGLWLLPPLSLIWANCHGGFFLGWIVLGAYSAEALWCRLRKRAQPGDRRLWVVALLSILLSGINPNHFRIFEILALYRKSFLTSTLIEWSRTPLWGPPYAFDALLYATAAVLALRWRDVRVSDALLFAAFAAAALLAFRNVMLVALVAPMLIAAYFPWKPKLPAATGLVAAFALAAGTAWGAARGDFFQFRAAEWRMPAGASDFLLANHVRAPLFNTYEYGGYLIWRLAPGERVFIDGRALNESVYQDYRRVLYNFGGSPAGMDGPRAEVLARYRISAIVMNAFEYVSGAVYPLAIALGQPSGTEWKLVYEDPQALVFLRRPPAGMKVLPAARVIDHLETECRLHIAREPDLCLCARTLGVILLRSGERERARRMFALYLAQPHPPDPEAEKMYAQLVLR